MKIVFWFRMLLFGAIGALGVPSVFAADASVVPGQGSAEIVSILTALYVSIRDAIVWWRNFRKGR